MLVFRTRLWGTAVSGIEEKLSTEIIVVFLGSFTGDATCNLDFTQGRNHRDKSAGPAEGHQLLWLRSGTAVAVQGIPPDVHQGDTFIPELGKRCLRGKQDDKNTDLQIL